MHTVLFYVHVSLRFSWHMLVPDSLKYKDHNPLSLSADLSKQTHIRNMTVVTMLLPYETIFEGFVFFKSPKQFSFRER